MAVGDADSDGVTSDELAAFLSSQLPAADIVRLRVGCVALIATIDKMNRRPKDPALTVGRQSPRGRVGAGQLPTPKAPPPIFATGDDIPY
jgi:hypothetical protein